MLTSNAEVKHASLVYSTTQFTLQHAALPPHPMAIISNSSFTYHDIVYEHHTASTKTCCLISMETVPNDLSA